MPVVLDANLLVALVSGDSRGDLVSQTILDLVGREVDLHAPELARYEFVNALNRLVVAKAFPSDRIQQAWNDIPHLTYKLPRPDERPENYRNIPTVKATERIRWSVPRLGRKSKRRAVYALWPAIPQRDRACLQGSAIAVTMRRAMYSTRVPNARRSCTI